MGPHPGLEIGEERRAQLTPHLEAALGGLAVNLTLEVEQRVDPRHRLQRHRRDRRPALATPLAGRDVGQLVEASPSMAPTQRLGHRPRRSVGHSLPKRTRSEQAAYAGWLL